MPDLDRLKKSRDLPLGHIERKKAEEESIKEYENSFKQEKIFMKRLPKRFRVSLSQELVKEVVLTLCSLIGTKKPKIIFNSTKVHSMAAAHYVFMELHFKWNLQIDVVIHELTHHINRMDRIGGSHGSEFLWTEQFLFDLFMNEILPIWKLKEQGL